jgi:hypothetical protein
VANSKDIINGLNGRFEVGVIPQGQALPTVTTLTTDTAAIVGALAVTFTAMPKALAVGDRIRVGSQDIYVAVAVPISTSPATVTLQKPVTAAIAGGATVSHMFLHPLSADKASIKFAGKTVETSGFGDGIFMDYMKNGIDGSLSVSGKCSVTDLAYNETILPLSSQATNRLYFVLADEAGVGNSYEGAAIVNDFGFDLQYRGVGEYNCSLQACGKVTITKPDGTPIVSY